MFKGEADTRSEFKKHVHQVLRTYIEERLAEIPLIPDDHFSFSESEEIPLTHTGVASVQFYKVDVCGLNFGMRLNHHPRAVTEPRRTVYKITTDVDFSEDPSIVPGTFTEIEEPPNEEFINEIIDSADAYELTFSVIKQLHLEYPERFPQIQL